MSFDVRFTDGADDDLGRLFDFLIDRAETPADFVTAQAAIDSIRRAALHQLAATPYSFRKAGKRSTLRELIVPVGRTGYVVLYEIFDAVSVLVLAIRHQREEDYH